jgi:hypothetical protein
MPDQADELRKLVLAQGGASDAYKGEAQYVQFVGRMKPRGRSPVEGVLDELASLKPIPDKAKLWDDLSADLERWVRVGGFDKPNLSTEALAEFWEMMQRRKEQA